MAVRPGLAALGRVAGVCAAVLGCGYAAVSAYWVIGGTFLLDTVGGVFERNAGTIGMAILVWLVVAAKLVAAGLPLAATHRRLSPPWRRPLWLLSWLAAAILTLYVLVMTAAGILVRVGVITAAPAADRRALAWHAFVWDPWFLLWGLLIATTLLATRGGATASVAEPDGERPATQ
jgi:hypothetical protein